MRDPVILLIKVPHKNEVSASSTAELLRTVHRVLPNGAQINLEIHSREQFLRFYIVIPVEYVGLIESQIYAQYPAAEIERVGEYLPTFSLGTAFTEVVFRGESTRPIATYKDSKEDFLKSFSALLAKTEEGEEVFLQFSLRRTGKRFWERSFSAVRAGLTSQKYDASGSLTKIGEKLEDDLYRGRLRIAYSAPNKSLAERKLKLVTNLFKFVDGSSKLRSSWLGSLKPIGSNFKARQIAGGDYWAPDEIATIYHFVASGGGEASNIVATTAKRAPAPEYLPTQGASDPKEISFFGETTYRNEQKTFGIKRIDRRRHLYVVGKTGVGKSKLMELLIISDILQGHGCCFLDPHGDSADLILKYVPKERINDVVYINPLDKDFPVGFNPLETVRDYETRHRLSTFFIAIFKKQFGATWNPRMEHLIRYITLALMETPDSCVLGIERMLTQTAYRQRVIKQIQDPVIKSFWTNEFSSWNERYANDAVVPILNKVSQFVSNPVMRNMVGQIRNALDFEKFMNEGNIVIINMAKGKLGEENIGLLGSMFITKIQQAALARSSIEEDKRRDFYFYVDEFQNFATDAFSSILSEARKYHLNLTIAHQYIAQLSQEVKANAFGNVASLVSFGVGGDDAAYLAKEFAPVFSAEDLMNLNAREIYVRMSIDGRIAPPFSGKTVNLPPAQTDYTSEILNQSRMKYARNRVEVENEIENWTNAAMPTEIPGEDSFPEPIL